MSRHLTPANIQSAIMRRKSVEQYLGGSQQNIISWLEIRPSKDDFQIWLFEVEDVGDKDFIDLYSFPPIGEDWPESPIAVHKTLEAALDYCSREHGAANDRWVNQFVIQNEYVDAKVKKAEQGA